MYIDIWLRLIHLCSVTVVSWPHWSHLYFIQSWPVCRVLVNSCCYFKITLIAIAVREAILYQNGCFFIHFINGPWPQSVTFRFQNFSVSKLFHFFGGFGFGIGKIWYRKKYRIRYRKNLVSKKVSYLVSEKFGIGKSFGFGFIQILGIVTHCWEQFIELTQLK